MRMPNGSAILAAEAGRDEAELLWKCLVPLGRVVRLASSHEAAVALLRRELFQRAVVAVELAEDGVALLARVSRLPSVQWLVALGPADPETEIQARAAGASAYVARPATTRALATALRLPLPQFAQAR